MIEIRAAAKPRWRRIVYLSAAFAGVAAGLAIGLALRPVLWPAIRAVPGPAARQLPGPAARQVPGRIPADARVLTVAPVLPYDPGTRQEWPGSAFTVTDPAKVARIAAVIDALPQLPPGVYDCPFGTGSGMQHTSMQLTFRTAPGGPVVASLIAVYATCQHVGITVGAHAGWLGDYTISGQQLQQQVLTIAGVRWS